MAEYAEETAPHGAQGEERLARGILADREQTFAWFVRLAAWGFGFGFLVVALLALTQT